MPKLSVKTVATSADVAPEALAAVEAAKSAADAPSSSHEPATTPAEPAATSPELPRDGFTSISVPVEATRLPDIVVEEKRPYWCGLLPDCPHDKTSRGGISFVKFTNRIVENKDGSKVLGETLLGEVHQISDRVLEFVLGSIKNHVLRLEGIGEDGKPTTARLLAMDDKYVGQSNDRPLSEYVYIVPKHDLMPDGWRARVPMSIAEASRKAAEARSAPSFIPKQKPQILAPAKKSA